ncbi:putative dihydroceramide synthase, partial [Trypanosoma conorhini]
MAAFDVAEGTRGLPANMYAMPLDRANAYGFVSRYNHTGDPATDRHANDLTFTREQLWWLATNPVSLQVHLNGWGGAGWDASALPQLLLPALLWAVVLIAVRFTSQRSL